MLVQQILNGLTNGSLYALMAVGVTMIYKSLGMLNFAHGDIMMLGTFICLSLINMNMPILAALLVAVVCTAGIGFILERLVLRQVEFSSFTNLLIATVGISYIFGTELWSSSGPTPRNFPACSPRPRLTSQDSR